MVLNTFVLVFWGASFSLRFLGKFADSSTCTVVSDIVLLAILGVSGFLGGSLSYRYGVRVATEAAQREGFDPRRDSPRPDPRDHKHRT